MKLFLQGFSKFMAIVGGVCFLFADRAFMEFGKIDFIFAEFLGIGIAIVCFGAAAVAHYKVDDIEWQEANDEAMKESERPMKS